MADSLTRLPPEVLQQLLRYLDQYHLACIAPLVCKTFRNAALAALQTVRAELFSQATSDQFSDWLQIYGHKYVCQLEVLTRRPTVKVQLKFAQEAGHLKELLIVGGRYPIQPDFDALQHLTSLSINDITADGLILQRMAALSHLSSLCLHGIDFGPAIATSSRDHISSAAQQIWSNCKQLTSLSIARCDLDDAAVVQLTQQLTALQHLDLSCNQLKAAAKLVPLPHGLTYLNLSYNHLHFDVSELLEGLAPGLAGNSTDEIHSTTESTNQHLRAPVCQDLKHFEISCLSLSQPLLLSKLTALTELQAQALQIPNSEEFLAALRSLPDMQHLNVCGTFCLPPGFSLAADSCLLNTALQAMPRLTHLDLSNSRILRPEYQGAEEHRPPMHNLLTAKLPELKVLSLAIEPAAVFASNSFVGPADLQLVIQNCPKLQQLRLGGRIHETVTGGDVQALLQLRDSLTSLQLGGRAFKVDDDVLTVLQQLSRLQELEVTSAAHVTDPGIMSLSNLRQLTHLSVGGSSDIHPELPQRLYDDGQWELKLTSKPGKAPNVWQQLAKRCNRIPACLLARQKRLEQDLKTAQQGVSKEHKHGVKAAKKAAALQKEITQLRQQLAALQADSSQGSM